MISVIVVLNSARDGKHYPLAAMTLSNRGEVRPGNISDYDIRQMSKTGKKTVKKAEVLNHPRAAVSIWKLVLKALKALGHDVVPVGVTPDGDVVMSDGSIYEL